MKTFITFFVLLSLAQFAYSVDYVFLGTDDVFYSNPDNWYPSYPGNRISFEDKILISSNAVFEGFNLIIEGRLEIELGTNLNSTTNSILVRQLGAVDNYGEVEVYSVINYGEFINNVSAKIDIRNYVSKNSAITNNFASSDFKVKFNMVNDGVFNNYGYCEIGQNLKNTHVFNQIQTSELLVTGTMLEYPGAIINHSEESVAYIKDIIEQ